MQATPENPIVKRMPSGKWVAICFVQTPAGPVALAATVHESTLRAALQSEAAKALGALVERARNGAVAGSIFGKAFRSIKRIGRGLGSTVSNLARGRLKKALQAAARTAQAASPLNLIPGGAKLQRQALQLATKAAPFLPVPGAAALASMITPARLAAAQRVMSAAQRGAPKARAALHRITSRARAGDARARQIAALLAQAARLLQPQAVAGAAYGRWVQTPQGEVFVPDGAGGAQSSGAGLDYVLDQLRPRLGYRRDTADVLTRRKAYRRGLQALATLRA
jgi:hypothetical protein